MKTAFCILAIGISCPIAASEPPLANLPAPNQHADRNHPPGQRTPPRSQPPHLHQPWKFGDPLPGLTADQLSKFTAGLDEFENVETPETGLGPIFNNVSCVSCHSAAATGGSSTLLVTRFGRLTNGTFDPLAELGGSLLQEFAIDPAALETVPPEANIIAHRQSTALFGLGLIEAIPDATILAGAARKKPDGISGHASTLTDVTTGKPRVGRFGWKAQQATLLAFAGDAYVNEMGITNRFFPHENAPNGNAALLAQFDSFIDPEDELDPVTQKADIDKAADFMRLLAPPPREPMTPGIRVGAMVFNQLGCAACHTPTMLTGFDPVRSLSRKPVDLFSDLLLHDMGKLGDGIEQGAAGQREMKTAPLWGLRASAPYLHDGRAATVTDAILGHEGEGAISRDRFNQLKPELRERLLEFLHTI